jgi:hypothetical protein
MSGVKRQTNSAAGAKHERLQRKRLKSGAKLCLTPGF